MIRDHPQLYYILSMSQVRSSGAQAQPLLSEKKRFPEVFRWKVAAIIISVLIAIFLVVDIILFVHYNNSQPRKINYTFVADVLDSIATKNPTLSAQSFANIITALSASYGQLWFQSASLVQSWKTPTLTLDSIGSFFSGDSDHQLFFFTLNDGTNNYIAAAYSHIGFPLPSGDWQSYLSNASPRNQYYTFEILDRQSVLMGGNSQDYLRMSGSTSNLLNCKVLALKKTTFTFLDLLTLDFSQDTVAATVDLATPYSTCFMGEPTQATVTTTLQQMLGITATTPAITLNQLDVFHLSQ